MTELTIVAGLTAIFSVARGEGAACFERLVGVGYANDTLEVFVEFGHFDDFGGTRLEKMGAWNLPMESREEDVVKTRDDLWDGLQGGRDTAGASSFVTAEEPTSGSSCTTELLDRFWAAWENWLTMTSVQQTAGSRGHLQR